MTGDERKCQADLALRDRAGRAAGRAAAPAGTRHQPPGTWPGPAGFYETGHPPAEGRSRSRRGEAVYPEEAINGHCAFIARRRDLRPSEEYRSPTEQEWEEFLGHFERRKVASATAAGPRHQLRPRAQLHQMPAPAGRPGAAAATGRHPRQPDRPDRRGRTRGQARPKGSRSASPSSTTSSPTAPPPSTSACRPSPTSRGRHVTAETMLPAASRELGQSSDGQQ